jgi:C4-type Zn-finger protein
MTQRTIYTCDTCGHEGTDRTDFEEIKVSRMWRIGESMQAYYDALMGNIIIARMLLCKECLERLFDVKIAEQPTPASFAVKEPMSFIRRLAALVRVSR